MSLAELIENYQILDLERISERVMKNGFVYLLVERLPTKCIYRQTKNGKLWGYEVFKTRIGPFREPMTKLALNRNQPINPDWKEYREHFPGDEEFGRRAWTYPTLESAMKKYNEIE